MLLIVLVIILLVASQPWSDEESGEPQAPATDTTVAETRAPPSPAPTCALSSGGAVQMSLPGCTGLLTDTGGSDPLPVWGATDCADPTRQRTVQSGGDPHPQASGGGQPDEAFRRLTLIEGDDVDGERCELGLNDHRVGPTVLYAEGQRRVTFLSVRLPRGFELDMDVFQVVMQMKQTQPSDNGGGTPALALEAFDGRWRLRQSDSTGPTSDAGELWSAPARTDVWTRFAFDVTYSPDPAVGRVKVYADLTGDGDFAEAGEQSETFMTYTLKIETEGDSSGDGISEGDSIPSHLRIGLYHDPAYSCPDPEGCRIDLDNVQVIEP